MSRRVPLYLSQGQIDSLAMLLYRHQFVTDAFSPTPHTTTEAACFLTELRKQCCQRSGAADPFEHMPFYPEFSRPGAAAEEKHA